MIINSIDIIEHRERNVKKFLILIIIYINRGKEQQKRRAGVNVIPALLFIILSFISLLFFEWDIPE